MGVRVLDKVQGGTASANQGVDRRGQRCKGAASV
jgi:hypothetical protein